MTSKVGVVIPTLGKRLEMLSECINSVRHSGANFIVLVGPKLISQQVSKKVDLCVTDPGRGLPEAINLGMQHFPNFIEYVTWIGDDDQFIEDGLLTLAKALDSDTSLTLVYGKCVYINSAGQELGINRIGKLAGKILGIGPDLVPQPSSLFRLRDFENLGGLNNDYRNAFDFDLFIRLKMLGNLLYVPELISKFRWHKDSLSVKNRWFAVKEASRVRKNYLHPMLSKISHIWEYPLMWLTYLAGLFINFRSARVTPTR